MKNILAIIGARPQFIKHASLELALAKKFNISSIHTGQHFDHSMSQVFFDELGMKKPDYMLSVSGGDHGVMTGRMMIELEPIFKAENPDYVLVYGDTNSTLAGALVASKLNITVVHVEAGLRSFNNEMPEEINRIITDRISSILLAPTEEAIKNLNFEGIKKGVFKTGDVMLDTLEIVSSKIQADSPNSDSILMTLHRPYNVDEPNRLKLIMDNVSAIGKHVIFPAHPRTKKLLDGMGSYDNIDIIDPLGYIDMINNLLSAGSLITDSGGMQKEAYYLKKKCITIRSETEWVETLTNGWNVLAFSENELRQLKSLVEREPTEHDPNLFGNGKAAEEIAEILFSIE